jgi:hypothetical protein
MLKLKESTGHNIVKLLILFLSLASAYSAITGLVFKISVADILANIYLQFFITFIPGLALYALTRKKEDHWLHILALAFALGYGINILEYFLLMPFGLGNFLKFFAPFASLLSIFILIKKPIHCPPPRITGLQESVPVVLFFIVLIIDVLVYSGTNASPLITGSATYNRDIQFWVNNTVGLLLNFPPQAPYLDGFTLHYHYFSNIRVAFSSLVSNIDIFTLSFPLYPLTKSLLLIGGLNYFLDVFNAAKKQKALLMTAIILSTGIESISIVTNFHHFHLTPFGLDVGFAFGAFFIASFLEQFNSSDAPLDWASYVATILFYAILVGAKAPLAGALSIFPAVLCLSWFFKKKYAHCFAFGIGIATLFLTISIYCVGMFSALNHLSDAQRMQVYTIDNLLITYRFPSVFMNLFISIAFRAFAAQPLLILLSAIASIKFFFERCSRKFKNMDISVKLALISTAMISVALSQMIDHDGRSQMYFMIAAYLPMAALSIDALVYPHQGRNRFVQKGLTAVSLLLLAAQIYAFLFAAWGGYSAVKSLKAGYRNISGSKAAIPIDSTRTLLSIEKSDVEGLQWIRENTPRDALLAVDRATFSADDTNNTDYFSYVMFSERQTFIEGTSMSYVLNDVNEELIAQRQRLTKAVFANSTEAYETLKAEGVDYIVQTKWVTPEFEPNSNLTLVHETDSLNIFKVEE